MSIDPRSSSIATSACTLGPCFLANAALMPSSSNPCNSLRPSCFVFDNSRIAARISVEPTIATPIVRVNVGGAARRSLRHGRRGRRPYLSRFVRLFLISRALSGTLFLCVAWRRDLQLVAPATKGHRFARGGVQPRLDGPRDAHAIGDAHPFAVAPVDTKLQ